MSAVVGGRATREKALGKALEPLLREVGDRHGFGAGDFVKVPNDVRPPVARADHAHPYGIAQSGRILGFAVLEAVTDLSRSVASRDRPPGAPAGGRIQRSRPP